MTGKGSAILAGGNEFDEDREHYSVMDILS